MKKSKEELYKFFSEEHQSTAEVNENDVYEDEDYATQVDEQSKKSPAIIEEEEYDLVGQEEVKEDQDIKSPQFAGESSKILSSISDYKAWIWRKEGLLTTSRFWALVYNSSVYMYKTAQDEVAVRMIQLEGGSLKKHKNGVKFVLTVPGAAKGGKDKQHQLHTENVDKTSQWIKSLQSAIASAGKKGTGNSSNSTLL